MLVKKQQYTNRMGDRAKENEKRGRQSECVDLPSARPCSALNLQCEPQMESLGFSLTPPTQCHVTLAHHTLSNSRELSENR